MNVSETLLHVNSVLYQIKELTEQLESLTKAQRERTVKEILEQKGINTKATRLILLKNSIQVS